MVRHSRHKWTWTLPKLWNAIIAGEAAQFWTRLRGSQYSPRQSNTGKGSGLTRPTSLGDVRAVRAVRNLQPKCGGWKSWYFAQRALDTGDDSTNVLQWGSLRG